MNETVVNHITHDDLLSDEEILAQATQALADAGISDPTDNNYFAVLFSYTFMGVPMDVAAEKVFAICHLVQQARQ